jgi:hypothetical protein
MIKWLILPGKERKMEERRSRRGNEAWETI